MIFRENVDNRLYKASRNILYAHLKSPAESGGMIKKKNKYYKQTRILSKQAESLPQMHIFSNILAGR